jgi:GT2 family glycosyltransferase
MVFRYSPFLPFAGACGLGVRRALFVALDGFDEQLLNGEDIDFCWRAQLGGAVLHFVPEAVVHIRLRSEPREVFRQTLNYGLWTVPLYKRYRAHGMPRVPWHRGARAWLRLLLRLPRLLRRSTRTKWLKEFAYRWGLLKGSIRFRTLAL